MAEQRSSSSGPHHPVPRVQAALEGRDACAVIVNDNSVLLVGDHQFYPGYCVLWARNPVKELQHLSPLEYMGFMIELRQACAAVESAYGPWKLNLASLGNQVQRLHVHLFPRSEGDAKRLEHPWVHAAEFKTASATEIAEAVTKLQDALRGVKP